MATYSSIPFAKAECSEPSPIGILGSVKTTEIACSGCNVEIAGRSNIPLREWFQVSVTTSDDYASYLQVLSRRSAVVLNHKPECHSAVCVISEELEQRCPNVGPQLPFTGLPSFLDQRLRRPPEQTGGDHERNGRDRNPRLNRQP